MLKEEKAKIEKIVDERINDIKSNSIFDLIIALVIGGLTVLVIFHICDTLKYNSRHKTYDEELSFCRSIYESDRVILNQCEKYFVILENEIKN